MDINTEITPRIIDNAHFFSSDFYRRFPQKTHPLALNDQVTKDYLFPTFYGNVTHSAGIFLCSYAKAAALMPHANLKPVKMSGGRTLIIFSCYEYKNVNQINPYNEIAMTIPILANPVVNVPILPMLAGSLFNSFGYHVFSMPVTSLENQIRGKKLWGLPKVTQKIDFTTENGHHTCTAFEESGEKYFELKVPMAGKKASFDECGYLYSALDDVILKSKTCFQGEYTLTKNAGRLFAKKEPATAPGPLWIGPTPSGALLKNLEIDSQPFQFRYATGVSSCFDLPEDRMNWS